ncbi:hypothetical protein [Vibrio tarriae]|uniref:hypothetical protein n=1 Tax=Vibrio tarriae TaxID=2014742 RepID=UPI0011BF1FE1|nr:hypothetical protein [Vibrio tarriae]
MTGKKGIERTCAFFLRTGFITVYRGGRVALSLGILLTEKRPPMTSNDVYVLTSRLTSHRNSFEPIPQATFSERHWHSLPMDVASSGGLPVE